MARLMKEKIVLKVKLDINHNQFIEVPVTPDTTCDDVIKYCALAAGEKHPNLLVLVELWRNAERVIEPVERIYVILDQWGIHRDDVQFFLREDVSRDNHPINNMVSAGNHYGGGRNGINEVPMRLPSGVDLTLSELQEMAARQHQKMEQQQQLLVAKEQRLKFLKQQEQKHQQASGQGDRLKRMRGRVEVLEAKLRKIRAQRGEAVQMVDSNVTLASELESMKSLFFEKEKELASAVSRVEELSKQLEEAKMGRVNGNTDASAATEFMELEKLRKDLMVRNKQNEQQNSALAAQHAILKQRKEEMTDLNQKIADLKLRVRKKKEESSDNAGTSNDIGKLKGSSSSSNVVAVEPFKHNKQVSEDLADPKTQMKQDSRYQTLPHSLKFKEDNVPSVTKESNIYDGLKSRKAFFENNIGGDIGKSNTTDDPKVVPKVNGMDTVDLSSKPAESGTRKATPPSYQSVMGLAAKQGSQSSYSKDMPLPPNTNAEVPAAWPEVTAPSTRISSLMTNFAPRPYGSTFSTSGNASKPTSVSVNISILSSPTTGGVVPNPKTSTPLSGGGHYGSDDATTSQPSKTYGSGLGGVTSGEPKGEAYPHTVSEPQSSLSSQSQRNQPVTQHGTISTGAPSSSLSTGNVTNTQVSSKDSQAPAPGSAMARLMNSSTAPAGAGAKPLYASKSVIANTYMRRLSPNAMDQYRKNMNQIYQGLGSVTGSQGDAGGQTRQTESPTARVRPMNMESSSSSGDSNGYNKDPPPYNIDPVKFRPNIPRVHRRRSSSGDSPQALERKVTVQRQISEDDDVFAKTPNEDAGSDPSKLTVIPPDLLQGGAHQIKVTHRHEDPSLTKDRSERLPLALRRKKGNLKTKDSSRNSRRVSFDPLALLLDASLEGELELVKKSAQEVPDPSCPNDEGITALHNAICAGHYEIVKFLVEYGCNVNAPDSDGWTPLHCAASCNNLLMVKVLVEHGACIFATTISDQETASAKCEEDEDGFEGCSEYLYNVQEKLGVMNNGVIYAVFDYKAQNSDELNFMDGDKLTVVRKGDETENEWWWAKKDGTEGYIPRNLFGLYPRTVPQWLKDKPTDKSSSDR